ncbi:MAG: GNAT family N-acetyltransferase [Bryobacterales bacterium]|nr:GNAT family N-acetyltransferase [Bryobacterales bacterium]
MPHSVTLRPRTPEDHEFLRTLYASTRTEELAHVPWPAETKQAFLAEQFRLQTLHYDQHYPNAQFLVIESAADGVPVGRLYLCPFGAEEMRLMDIALLPEWRSHGIGGALLRDLLESARKEGRKVTCHVEFNNPALRLYQRLGFQPVERRGAYLFMQCIP